MKWISRDVYPTYAFICRCRSLKGNESAGQWENTEGQYLPVQYWRIMCSFFPWLIISCQIVIWASFILLDYSHPKYWPLFYTLLQSVFEGASYGYCIGYCAMYISCQLPLPSLLGSTIILDSEHYVPQFAAAWDSPLYHKQVTEVLEWTDVCMVASMYS